MARRHKTSDGLKLLHKWYIEGNPEMEALLEEERKNARIARDLFDMREKAGLSQRELAKLARTSASVICTLEDGDYEGHSLSMLRRVAAALGHEVEVRFTPVKRKRKPRDQRVASKSGGGAGQASKRRKSKVRGAARKKAS